MEEKKTSEAQRRASDNWDEKNKEKKRYIIKRSTAKNFILNHATDEDLNMLKELIDSKEENS